MNYVLFSEIDNVFTWKKKQDIKKLLENGKKLLGKSGIFVSLGKWEP